ncbi:MAG: hypothetical protein NT150_07500 [Bacteroidetes bacterium]|nr:hypothetical protein [Bacteroidota bacterium]
MTIKKNTQLEQGDVFCIKTKIGNAFFQYIETDNLGQDFIRILDYISVSNNQIKQEDVNRIEKWNISFTIKPALRKHIIEKIGNFEIPTNFMIPQYTRSEHNIRGNFLGWFIVNRKSLQRELKEKLSEEELKLSPSGFMNDTLIIERIEQNWTLKNWNK